MSDTNYDTGWLSLNSFTAVCSESISAGDLVNLWVDGGVAKIRKASAASNYATDGFVIASYSASNTARVYVSGSNSFRTGLTVGPLWLGTGGAPTSTIPTANTSQRVGFALSTTEMLFQRNDPIIIL